MQFGKNKRRAQLPHAVDAVREPGIVGQGAEARLGGAQCPASQFPGYSFSFPVHLTSDWNSAGGYWATIGLVVARGLQAACLWVRGLL